MKDYEIEILEDWDPIYGVFTFSAMKYSKPFGSDKLPVKTVTLPGKFGVYIGTAESFLSYFIEEYFDRNLSYNVEREDVEIFADEHGIMWNLDNYYTRESVEAMCDEILEVAHLFRHDYDNPMLFPIKERFEVYEMLPEDSGYIPTTEQGIREHIDNVIDFYKRFVARMRKMIQMNPDLTIIRFDGP